MSHDASPNESCMGAGATAPARLTQPAGAQPYIFHSRAAPASSMRSLGPANTRVVTGIRDLTAIEDVIEASIGRTPHDGGYGITADRVLKDRDGSGSDCFPCCRRADQRIHNPLRPALPCYQAGNLGDVETCIAAKPGQELVRSHELGLLEEPATKVPEASLELSVGEDSTARVETYCSCHRPCVRIQCVPGRTDRERHLEAIDCHASARETEKFWDAVPREISLDST